MQVRKLSFAPIEAKIHLFKSYCYLTYTSTPIILAIYPIYTRRHSYQNSIRKVTINIVTHSSILLTSPDTPAPVWHLR